jgi:hypothetical protein
MSDEPMETFEHDGFTVNIHSDHDSEGPDGWGDEGVFLVGFHRQFSVERDGIKSPEDVVWYWPKERIVQHLIEDEGYDPADAKDEAESGHIPGYEVFPLQAYIHSGVSLSLGSFSCPWDSGHVGWVLVKLSEVGEGTTDAGRVTARVCAEGLVETWNQYLSGDVWGFVITDSDGAEVEDGSCWGFYGMDECIAEAKRTCPSVAETREVNLNVLFKDGTWASAAVAAPLSVGDNQVPAFAMTNTYKGYDVDSVYLAGGE